MMMGTVTRICATLCALLVLGCGDRAPVQVCPVPIEVTINESLVGCFDGLDLLIVVDNSESMAEEQAVLASGVYSLINALVNPVSGSGWPWFELDSLRVAVVSSDMGLQYGADHDTEGFPYGKTQVPGCTDQDAWGDDGRFQTSMPDTVKLESGVVECPQLEGEALWAQTLLYEKNEDLATQIACLGQVGTSGCGVEQQLETSVRALSRNDAQNSFIKDAHLLAVLVVSDKEDCSIEDRGLFDTPEWKSGTVADVDDPDAGLLKTACNLPAKNEEDFLFGTERYWNELVSIKGDQPRAVMFGAIVGVPMGDDSPCQGRGNALGDCLAHEDMQLETDLLEDGEKLTRGFAPACERRDGENVLTRASPGRRYVKVAESFGPNGYVSSICNGDWTEAMKEFAWVISKNAPSHCYPKSLEWAPLSKNKQEELGCPECGVSKCSLVVTFEYGEDKGQTCPAEFGIDPDDVFTEYDEDKNGEITKVSLHCPLPRLPAELDCDRAMVRYPGGTEAFGWFYCENWSEDFDETCSDGIDNDGEDGTDCDDPKCEACCDNDWRGCKTSCKYNVEMTKAAKEASRGNMTSMQCKTYIPTDDENCQENTKASCNDGIDNDGNGVFDCNDEPGGDVPHFAEPHCCPMTVDENKMCVIDTAATEANCGESIPDACMRAALLHGCDMSDYR